MKRLIGLSLLFLISLVSCQMQKIMVSVYTPSKIAFPPEVRSLLVTSRYVPATGPYEDVQWGAYESVDSLKWTLSESLVDTLAKRMAAKNKYLVKARHFLHILRNNDDNLPEPVSWDGLSNLAKKEYVQAILLIEGFGLTKTPVVVSENNGSYQAQCSIGVTMAVRIYEPEKMRMIDDSVYTFSTEFKGEGTTEQGALKPLEDNRKALLLACSRAAEAYYELIKPGEAPAIRYYYPSGDSSMIKAGQAVKDNKWGKAESKWKWLAYNSKDSVIQAKASYNMALACERDGRINQAIGFARRSQRIKPDNHTSEYINVLNKKILDYDSQVQQKMIIRRW